MSWLRQLIHGSPLTGLSIATGPLYEFFDSSLICFGERTNEAFD